MNPIFSFFDMEEPDFDTGTNSKAVGLEVTSNDGVDLIPKPKHHSVHSKEKKLKQMPSYLPMLFHTCMPNS